MPKTLKNYPKDSPIKLLCVMGIIAVISCSSPVTAATWTNWNNSQKIGSFFAVAGTARETVAVGIDGLIATRNNNSGVWTTQVFSAPLDFHTVIRSVIQRRMPNLCDPDFRAIVHAKNQYVVVRESGLIMTSPDGLKWKIQNSRTKNNLLGLFWDGHQYLAGGDHGTILSSPDGIKWTTRDSGCRVSFYAFSYSGKRYVVVGNDGICISDDAATWRAPTTAPTRVPFTACTWTGSEFLACGLGLGKNPTIYTSPEGEVWTLRDTTITESLRAAITINGVVFVTGDSVIKKSTDGGITWEDTFTNSRFNNLFMGLSCNDQSLIAVGFNHNVWALRLLPTSADDREKQQK